MTYCVHVFRAPATPFDDVRAQDLTGIPLHLNAHSGEVLFTPHGWAVYLTGLGKTDQRRSGVGSTSIEDPSLV